MEQRIQKWLGVEKVIFALREGDRLIRDNGRDAFTSGERALFLKHFGRKPGPWRGSKKNKEDWYCLWPVRSGKEWIACYALGWKKNGTHFTPEEKYLLDLVSERTALTFETRRWMKALARSDRQSAIGFMSLAMAHEIRNPLTAMGTLVQLLPRKKSDEKFMDEFQKVMNREINRLTHLTESVLDFSKDGGEKSEPVDFQEVVDQVVKLLKPLFDMKKTRLIVRNPRVPHFTGNDHQMQSLIMNLLQNAFQSAGPGGMVQISTSLTRGKSGPHWIQLSVRDDGPGIPKENLKNIFNPYFSTKNGGTGLGLAICRKIVADHQGFLTAKSFPQKGAEFKVLLPI